VTARAYQIVIVKPAGFGPIEPFREVMESVQYGLSANGYDAPIRENTIVPGATPIVFGAHYLSRDDALRLPPDTIIYNLEQLAPGYPWYQAYYLELLGRFRVWDYNASTVRHLRMMGIARNAFHVPIGHAPCWTRITTNPIEDVDVLFYGVQTPRRMHILQALGDAGLNVVALNSVWGTERDRWIARSKVALSMHQADTGTFEIVRVMFLLANGRSVVAEVADVRSIDNAFAGAFVPSQYEELVESCLVVARSPDLRAHLRQMASRSLRAPNLQAPGIIARALSACAEPATSGESAP
jgi:hypothetical protein